METTQLLHDLQQALDRLADAVTDEPPIASALRRFAASLPALARHTSAPPPLPRRRAAAPSDPTAIRGLLYRALDAGTLDSHRFDWLMLARTRARARRLPRTAGGPEAGRVSP